MLPHTLEHSVPCSTYSSLISMATNYFHVSFFASHQFENNIMVLLSVLFILVCS